MKVKNYNVVVVEGDLPADATFPNGMAAVDTETMGLNIQRDRLCLVQVANGEGDVWLVRVAEGQTEAPNLQRLLENRDILKVFHFARFDVAVLAHYLGVRVAPIYCTKIASRLSRTNSDRHGLKQLVLEMLGLVLDKEQQSSYWAAPVLSESQKHYAASDVIYLHALKQELDVRLKDAGRLHLAQQCFDFMPTRCALDLAGWENEDIFSHA